MMRPLRGGSASPSAIWRIDFSPLPAAAVRPETAVVDELDDRELYTSLKNEGIRDKVTPIASGGLRNVQEPANPICLGADGAVIGAAELVALEWTPGTWG